MTSTAPTLPDKTSLPARVRHQTGRRPEIGLVLVILAVGAGITVVNDAFLTSDNLFNLLRSVSILGIVAVGMTYVLVAGELDLSVGSGLALAGVVAADLATSMPWPLATAAGILTGAAVGAVSGLLVTRLGINSFIVTLGMLSIARGLALLITGGLPVESEPALQILGQGALGQVPLQVVLMLVVVFVGHWVFTRTVFGQQVQAVGDNRDAARLAGIPVARVKVSCFVILGCLVGVAALVRSSQLGVAEPNAAVGLELDVIAATIIGGTSLSGGRGTVLGALLGAILLGMLQNAFVLLHLSNFLQVLATGVIIIGAAAFDRLRQRRAPGRG